MVYGNKSDAKNYLQNYYQENKEKIIEQNKLSRKKRQLNPDSKKKQKEYMKHFNKTHKEYNRLRAKKYRENNKEKINSRRRERNAKFGSKQKEYNDKLKLEVFTHYCDSTPHCMCPKCIETNVDFLTIDHINGNGCKHRKEIGSYGMAIYRYLKKNNYPSGYQVLCYNCNCGKTRNKNICPHYKNETLNISI